jgi:polar amino acid transport system substrate-binding protein
MQTFRRLVAVLAVATVAITACSSVGTSSTAPASAAGSGAIGQATPIPGGLLDKILSAGKIVISTDPKYPPQSELKPDGSYQGFDIDVATEVAKRLGETYGKTITIEYVTPEWTQITAGNWGGRWDLSVGSMTILPERLKVLDFTQPYFWNKAQFAASKQSGITTLDGLENKTVCTSEGSTFSLWLDGKLDFGPDNPIPSPPAGVKGTTLPNEGDCPQAWQAGRFDFEGWLASQLQVDKAVSDGLPVVKIGDPAFFQPDALAVDKSGPNDSDFMAWLDKTIGDMHADGTLTAISMRWYPGLDITTME